MKKRLLFLGLTGVVVVLGVASGGSAASSAGAVWGKAITVPGSVALNSGGHAEVSTVSCPAAGDCAAGGYYYDGSGAARVFVASEAHGVWGNAVEVPGTAALNSGINGAGLNSVSCAAAG